MAYSDTSIIIHLLKDTTNPTLDDTIRIVKNLDHSVFEVTYKDCDNSLVNNRLVHKVHKMTRHDVYDYVYLLLKNLVFDEDGYQKIQFSLPAMPRVLINASNLNDTYYKDHFLELIESGLNMLDKVENLSIKKISKNNSSKEICSNAHSSECGFYCTSKKNTAFPELPASPVHTYFH